jgi:hypothetical protein
MVLDRANATVWGVSATAGATISVALNGAAFGTATVASSGSWKLRLGEQSPGIGHSLTFNASDGSAASLADVAFGDVILCRYRRQLTPGQPSACTHPSVPAVPITRAIWHWLILTRAGWRYVTQWPE